MKLFIKNMADERSKASSQQKALKSKLVQDGLELVNDKQHKIVVQISKLIIEIVHKLDERPVNNYSRYISQKLHYDYRYLSNLFSEVHKITIQQCIIAHKVEKVKLLLNQNELTVTQIAKRLHYSSVSHLANQFKKVTGVTTRQYRNKKHREKIDLEKVCDK